MIKYENECCDCSTPLYPCVGNSCSKLHVPHYYCDECESEEQLYEFEGKELCLSCIEKRLEKVN